MDQAPDEKLHRRLFDAFLALRDDLTEPANVVSSENLSERCWIPIDSLVFVDSPMVREINLEHARALAELDTRMPPITVQRDTMRVIDGMHRLRAAMLCGQDTIEARFFDGSAEDAFVLAVQLNVRHGLPLSRADRNSAAQRIVCSHPDWSDRLIASIVGLSPKTVGAIRLRSSEEVPQFSRRVGRDGRTRRIGHSWTPATEPAERTGPSASAPTGHRRLHALPGERNQPNTRQRVPEVTGDLLFLLRRDPSLRMTELGRHLLRFMDVYAISNEELNRLIECVPPHCVEIVIRLARNSAIRWNEFADALVTREPTESA